MKYSVAFIGSVGVPNNYGGFEMFLESCAPFLTHSFAKVFVTCDRARYQNRERDWHGVDRVFIPIPANGSASVLHDLVAFFAVIWRADAIVVLGVSGGIFFPLFRAVCSIFRKRLIVNVDGIEWRRAKFSRMRRGFLYVSDRMAQVFSHRVVVDNEALRPFLVPAVRKTASLIAYPGDHVVRGGGGIYAEYTDDVFLTICRIEPENNCHLLIEAFARASRGRYIFVGNWDASHYGRHLRNKFLAVPGLEMRDPVYDKDILASLRESCSVYLHGHSVGGTNPSLVEMLFYDCDVLAFDCEFNHCTAGAAIEYFSDVEGLAEKIRHQLTGQTLSREVVREMYTKERICGAYQKMIDELLRPRGWFASIKKPFTDRVQRRS